MKASTLKYSNSTGLNAAVIDSMIMIRRSSTHIIRNTDQLLGAFFQPVMFMILFVAVFGGAVESALPTDVSYINFLMAGIIVQTVAFNGTTTAIAMTSDMQRGIMDRFRSLPMANVAVIAGHVISDVFRSGISVITMVAVGLIMGFRTDTSLLDWIIIAILLDLFTLAFSWLSAIVGVLAKSVEGVQWQVFVIVFPLTFMSSAFVPAESMPIWLKGFAENQPVTHAVEAVRALMIGSPIGNHGWLTIIWCVVLIIIAMPVTLWLFKNKTAGAER